MKLGRAVIKTAHSLGYPAMTKTKQMLRHKYWFPYMNRMVEQMIGHCRECQVTIKEQRKEPLKMTAISEKSSQIVSEDFGRPYPDGY